MGASHRKKKSSPTQTQSTCLYSAFVLGRKSEMCTQMTEEQRWSTTRQKPLQQALGEEDTYKHPLRRKRSDEAEMRQAVRKRDKEYIQ